MDGEHSDREATGQERGGDGPVGLAGLYVSLRARLAGVLAAVLPAGGPCALVGFPRHGNVGDHMIWYATMDYLRERKRHVAYVCDQDGYRPDDLARRIGDGTILLTGGGDLGDLWPREQAFRERVIGDFPDVRILQLPQSIHFKDATNLARAAAVFERHSDLTLLVREETSLERARAGFDVPVLLCPDMAFAMDPPVRKDEPDVDVYWLARADQESFHPPLAAMGPGVVAGDWNTMPGRWTFWHACRRAAKVAARRSHGRVGDAIGAQGAAHALAVVAARHLAARHLDRGVRNLGRGRVVVTDRLHGHILSLMLGIPHVVLDNSYGKLAAFHRSWSQGNDLVQLAVSADDALERARRLL